MAIKSQLQYSNAMRKILKATDQLNDEVAKGKAKLPYAPLASILRALTDLPFSDINLAVDQLLKDRLVIQIMRDSYIWIELTPLAEQQRGLWSELGEEDDEAEEAAAASRLNSQRQAREAAQGRRAAERAHAEMLRAEEAAEAERQRLFIEQQMTTGMALVLYQFRGKVRLRLPTEVSAFVLLCRLDAVRGKSIHNASGLAIAEWSGDGPIPPTTVNTAVNFLLEREQVHITRRGKLTFAVILSNRGRSFLEANRDQERVVAWMLQHWDQAEGWPQLASAYESMDSATTQGLAPKSFVQMTILRLLNEQPNGEIASDSGHATAPVKEVIGLSNASVNYNLNLLADHGYIEIERRGRRTFRIAITNLGREYLAGQ